VPKIFEWKGYKFFFFSNEGSPREPRHVHVRKGSSVAKFWIDPEISLESSYEMSSKELNGIESVIEEKADLIRRKWNEHFGS
jgi:hypothetical protein